MSGALDGVRVLDLSRLLPGGFCSLLLADFGADVVKVEPPGGDPARSDAGFAMWNRGKRSIVVDAGDLAGGARLDGLLAGADVLVVSGPAADRHGGPLDAADGPGAPPHDKRFDYPQRLDGVPVFTRWLSGVSSRTFDAPYWISRIRSMNSGPSSRPQSSAVKPAAMIRNEGYRRTLKTPRRPASG